MMGVASNRTVQPLSPEIQGLLAYERDVVPQPEIVLARALARARESLREQEAVMLARRRTPRPFLRLAFAAAAGLVLMAGVAGAYQMLRSPHGTSPESSPRFTPRGHRVAPPAWEPPSPAPAAADPSLTPPKNSGPGARASQEELRFLVRARQADAHGDYAKVLSLLAQHQHDHPVGRLAEEREFLRVKALVGLGRRGQARQVASNFRHQFPRSVLLSKVDEMLTSSR